MTAIAVAVYAVLGYLAVGSLVAVFAVVFRPHRLDPRLASAPRRVKLVLLPGSAVFWPVVVARALRGTP